MTIQDVVLIMDKFRSQYNTSRDPYVQKLCKYVTDAINKLNSYAKVSPNLGTIYDSLSRDIAENYVPFRAYNIGEFCIYDFRLYVCNTPIEENQEGPFNKQHWSIVNVTNIINNIDVRLNATSSRLDSAESKISEIEDKGCTISENTTEGWSQLPSYIPKKGEFCIYTDYYKKDGSDTAYPAIKIGDGNSYLADLPFTDEGSQQQVMDKLRQHEENFNIHITPEERNFWNNKLNYNLSNENLIFTLD